MSSAAEQLAANFNFSTLSKATELKQRLMFTLLALIVARLGTYIPMPGIDAAELARQIQQQQGSLLDVFNLLAGGAIGRMAIFALGIMPYISASIIIQLMTTVSPTLEQLKKGDRQAIRTAFDELYEHRYAHHSPEESVEIINVRLAALGKKPKLNFPKLGESGKAKPARTRKVCFSAKGGLVDTPVYERSELGAGAKFTGPALIQEHGTTTVMFEGDECTVAPTGELIIKVGNA